MRSFQYWVLMFGSTVVSLLMLKQIILSRALNREQRQYMDSQAFAATAQEYGNAWQTLAMHIYQASRQDPAFATILKQAAVDVRTTPPPVPTAGATNAAPTSVVPANALVPMPAPAPTPKPPVAP